MRQTRMGSRSVLWAAAWLASSAAGFGQSFEMPDLVGKTVEEAQLLLADAPVAHALDSYGEPVKVDAIDLSKRVYDQSPPAQTVVTSSAEAIRLYALPVAYPDIAGVALGESLPALRNLPLYVIEPSGPRRFQASDLGRVVVAQTQAAGTLVPPNVVGEFGAGGLANSEEQSPPGHYVGVIFDPSPSLWDTLGPWLLIAAAGAAAAAVAFFVLWQQCRTASQSLRAPNEPGSPR